MKVDPTNACRWKHNWCFHNRAVVWDTPLTKWASEGNDNCGNGGAGASICEEGWTIGWCTSFVHTTKKLMLGVKKELEA